MHPPHIPSFALRPLAAACLLLPLLAQAQGAPQQAAVLQAVTVRSTLAQSPVEQTPASVSVLDGEQLRDRQWQVNLSESLGGTPGLLLQNRQNYAQDLQLSIRGHGARSTFGVRGIQVFVDGIPATMPDGQGQTNHIDLSSLERIEVLRGPYSALYGNASGGVIQAWTERGQGRPSVQGSFALGSNGQKRLGLKAQGEAGGVGYVVSASRFLTDGWRVHSAADKNQLNLRLDTQPREDTQLTLVANHTAIDAQDAGGLTPAEWRADPRATAAGPLQFNMRKTMRQTQAGLTWERRLDGASAVRATLYAGTRAITQYQSIPVAAQKAPTSAGGVIDLGRDYGGLDLRWAHNAEPQDGEVGLIAGLAASVVREDRQGYNNHLGDVLGVQGTLRRDERNTLSNLDPYAQASWAFAPRWRLDAGVRYSRVRFESRDHYIAPGNGDDSGDARYRRLLPVLSLQHAWDARTQFYASVGGGLETPTFNEISYRPGGLAGLNFGLRPATSTSAEVGVRQRLAGDGLLRGDWSAALFHTRTQDEIVPAENAGGRTSYQNAGRTRRQGLELAGTLQLARAWQLQGALTLLDATLREGFCDAKGNCVPAGRRIAGTARRQAWLALDWRPDSQWRAGVEWRHLGSIAANDSNSVLTPSYGVLAASAGHTLQRGAWKLDTFARIDNLTDRQYVGSVIVNESNGRYFEGAPGRQWMLGLSLTHQF
ncbi:iron complex outermembrane recepter protein [Oryzisolibacter propanilivorax]|uniref:Iron complex outermembrane recepter protein n=1 Tax=Oryzisolibacter propanilivorax TaxID=1527607 RepID=A0A1G9VK87_9BURK|nr:TonB-dependent receptor [Oryzisolibacter propanilivorax]SDM72235.1 iron complex outermembrane recepter protein [Oryzisolibacter propanilivorax]